MEDRVLGYLNVSIDSILSFHGTWPTRLFLEPTRSPCQLASNITSVPVFFAGEPDIHSAFGVYTSCIPVSFV